MKEFQSLIQPAWGLALLLMGIAFFSKIPDIMDQISDISYFQGVLTFMRICLYIMAILLVGGGLQKLRPLFRKR